MQAFLNQGIPVIMHCVVILVGIGLPIFATFIYKKFHGSSKYSQAVKLAEAALQFIKGYAAEHPEILKDAQAIYDLFKERIVAVLPLTDAEVDYLFGQLKIALADLLGVDVSVFASINTPAVEAAKIRKKAPKIFGRHKKHLFS